MKKLFFILGFCPLFLDAQIRSIETLLRFESVEEEEFNTEMLSLKYEYTKRYREPILTQTEEEFIGVLVGIEFQKFGNISQIIRKGYNLEFDSPCDIETTNLEFIGNLRHFENLEMDLKRLGFQFLDNRQEYVRNETIDKVNYETVVYFDKKELNNLFIYRNRTN